MITRSPAAVLATPLIPELDTDFTKWSKKVTAQFNKMSVGELYQTDANIWDAYLAKFPDGTNPIFRTKTEHDCRCCQSFIRNLGTIVSIDGDKIVTVWDDCTDLPYPYDIVNKALAEAVKASSITSVYRSIENSYGKVANYDAHDPKIIWNHFNGALATKHKGGGSVRGPLNDAAESLRRAIDEFSITTVDEVIEVIEADGIYRGVEYLNILREFRRLKVAYEASTNKAIFHWANLHNFASRIRGGNVIGTLLGDLSEGKTLEKAVFAFEAKVAPGNYKRPTALVTPKMIDSALAKLRELDLEDSIHRRHARLSDLSINDVLWVNNDASPKMQDPLRSLLLGGARTTVATPKEGQSINIDALLASRPSKLELILKSQHLANFVSITTAMHTELNPLFAWRNSFAHSYDGEVTDSIKQRVEKAGGNINAKLRCSLAWFNFDDLDVHCYGPQGHIYYGRKNGDKGLGPQVLDVDMNANGPRSREPVENLSWTTLQDGKYEIKVHNFSKRESVDVGCKLQVEFQGVVKDFSYPQAIPQSAMPHMLTLHVENGLLVKIDSHPGVEGGTELSVTKWGVKTGSPSPVDTIMLSPNYWESGNKQGNKHWFFILKDCLNPDPVRGIYNEYLRPDLIEHRKVFELLGSRTKCEYSPEQLSGVGFSQTQRAKIDVLADGRPYQLEF